jgi:hypothetical protein
MTSLVLGTIALLLFLMPILGIPISAFGLLSGILSCIAAPFVSGARLRWSLAGVVLSSLALAINLAIAYAPAGYLPDHHVPQPWQAVPDRPYTPPPARQSEWPGRGSRDRVAAPERVEGKVG